MSKIEITTEAVKKAHKEGCSDVKKVLETLFPDALKNEPQNIEPFEVSQKYKNKMIAIACGYAPDNLSDKCFVLNEDEWDWDIRVEKGHTILIPSKKR